MIPLSLYLFILTKLLCVYVFGKNGHITPISWLRKKTRNFAVSHRTICKHLLRRWLVVKIASKRKQLRPVNKQSYVSSSFICNLCKVDWKCGLSIILTLPRNEYNSNIRVFLYKVGNVANKDCVGNSKINLAKMAFGCQFESLTAL